MRATRNASPRLRGEPRREGVSVTLIPLRRIDLRTPWLRRSAAGSPAAASFMVAVLAALSPVTLRWRGGATGHHATGHHETARNRAREGSCAVTGCRATVRPCHFGAHELTSVANRSRRIFCNSTHTKFICRSSRLARAAILSRCFEAICSCDAPRMAGGVCVGVRASSPWFEARAKNRRFLAIRSLTN